MLKEKIQEKQAVQEEKYEHGMVCFENNLSIFYRCKANSFLTSKSKGEQKPFTCMH